jgi:predicted dehydrogenase
MTVSESEAAPVRLGLVGLGDWGVHVALAAQQIPGAQIAGCYARSPATREAFSQRFGCVSYASYEEMVADVSLSGIIIMTPNNVHREQVTLAAAHGKHCLLTKPIAASIEDGLAIIWASEAAGVTLAIGHQSRREPALRRLKHLLADGALGAPVLVEANISTLGGLHIEPGQWRWSRSECPGGPLIQLGVHHVDTLQYLLGPIVRVQSWQRRAATRADIDDVTGTLLEFESGLQGYLGSSYVSSEACWIKVYGTQVAAHYDQLLGLMLSQDSWEEGPIRKAESGSLSFQTPIATMIEEIDEFVTCIRTGKAPEIDGWQGLRNLAVVLAAVRSAETGQPVDVADLLPTS